MARKVMPAHAQQDTLTASQAAKLANVDPNTIRRWMTSNKLKTELTPEGWRVVKKDDLMAYLTQASMPATNDASHISSIHSIKAISHGDRQPIISFLEDALEREKSAVQRERENFEAERKRCERLEEHNRQLQIEVVQMNKQMQALINKESGILRKFWNK